MQLIVGFVILIVSILAGYLAHHGNIWVLFQPTEFIIIGGAAFGAVVIGSGFHGVKAVLNAIKTLFSFKPRTQEKYLAIMKLLFKVFDLSRKDGILALEKHLENPEGSDLFTGHPEILNDKKIISFICDNLRIIVSGGDNVSNLEALIDIDIDSRNDEEMHAGHIFSTVGDGMPAFGIVAAVLGVIITMQAINGPPAEIGEKVGAALVGTFLGVLLAYGVFQPLASAWTAKVKNDELYLLCIRNALLAFARADTPLSCLEAARRQILPEDRPSFSEVENFIKDQPTGGEVAA